MIRDKNESSDDWEPVRLLKVKEVAGWARVHPKTVYRWINDEKIFAIRMGKKTYRIPEPEVRRYLHELGYDNLITAEGISGGDSNE